MTDADRITARAELIEIRLREAGCVITIDGRIDEGALGRVLAMDPRSVANMRREGAGPHFYRIGAGNGSRISYTILDVSRWLETHRTDPQAFAAARDR